MLIDTVLPAVHGSERHAIAVPGPAERVLSTAAQVTWNEVPRTKLFVRPKDGTATVMDGMADELGFRELARTPDERVLGAIIKLPKAAPVPIGGAGTLADFESFDKPGHLKLAFNFQHSDGVLTTRTLVQGTGRVTALLFRLVWLGLRFGSGYTRKEWLRAVRRRLETSP